MVGLDCFMTGVLYQGWEWRVAGINQYSLLPPLSIPRVPVSASDPKRQDSAWTVHWGWGVGKAKSLNASSTKSGRTFTIFILTALLPRARSDFSWLKKFPQLHTVTLIYSPFLGNHIPQEEPQVKLAEPTSVLSIFHDYGASLLHAPLISPTSLRLGLH